MSEEDYSTLCELASEMTLSDGVRFMRAEMGCTLIQAIGFHQRDVLPLIKTREATNA